MKTKLYLAAIGAALAFVVPTASAPAQTQSYYGICPAGQVPDPANPYYCIPDTGTTKKRPKLSLKVKPKKDRSAPIKFKASGKLTSLKGVSKKRGCKGKVKVTVKRGKKTVAKKTAKVKKSCKYSSKVKVKSGKLKNKGKLKVRARFGGNNKLKSAKSKTRTVKYRL